MIDAELGWIRLTVIIMNEISQTKKKEYIQYAIV
jgi:hypothetical protein